MTHLPGAEIPQRVAEFIGLRPTRHRRRRQKQLPRNLHLSPGTLHVSPEELPPKITAMAYGPDGVEERTIERVADLENFGARAAVLWVNIEGLGDPAVLKELAATFKLHPLAMEDVADTTQRAKVEPYGDTIFVVLPLPHHDERGFWTEQLSMFVTQRFVITFQSAYSGDCLDQLRMRIREARGRTRTKNAPYLAYAIADATIDAYFPVVNSIGDTLEELEEVVLNRPSATQLAVIRKTRSELLRLRRSVMPLRDAMNAFSTIHHFFDEETRPYLRDLDDHVYRLLDQLETDRFLASDLLEIYMTSVNLKVGEITKVLTIIATIFIPLSFIASIFGMNFKNMPELEWHYGYAYALALMAATAGVFLIYFWRKGWLRDSTKPPRRERRAKDAAAGAAPGAAGPHPDR